MRQQKELDNQNEKNKESNANNLNLKSAFNADRNILMQKLDDLEAKLSNKIREAQQLEQKIHILVQSESAQKNELNFWNGKVATLRRDAEYQQIFAENLQNENRKLQLDIENLQRELSMKSKTLALKDKELGGMVEDNERLNRMYQIV